MVVCAPSRQVQPCSNMYTKQAHITSKTFKKNIVLLTSTNISTHKMSAYCTFPSIDTLITFKMPKMLKSQAYNFTSRIWMHNMSSVQYILCFREGPILFQQGCPNTLLDEWTKGCIDTQTAQKVFSQVHIIRGGSRKIGCQDETS